MFAVIIGYALATNFLQNQHEDKTPPFFQQ